MSAESAQPHARPRLRDDPGMDTQTLLRLAVSIAKHGIDRTAEPAAGDLVVEVTGLRVDVDPDGIGWLVGHDLAPYSADDPLDGSVPMREVWDIRPLNPAAQLQDIGGEMVQRWENAQFCKVRRVPPELIRA